MSGHSNELKKTIATEPEVQMEHSVVPVMEWPEYQLTDVIDSSLRPRAFGKGVLYGIWPLYVEAYYGDEEPDRRSIPFTPLVPLRIISWDRNMRREAPKSWRSFGTTDRAKVGYVVLSKDMPYETSWSKRCKERRNYWRRVCLDQVYTVEKVSYDVFLEAYKKSTTAKRLPRDIRFFSIQLLAKKRLAPKGDVEFWCARHIAQGQIVGGIAVEFSASTKNTYYSCGFHLREERDPIMVGLVDHWFKRSLEKGMSILNFGLFWQEGNPVSWKGFSSFKSKFGVRYTYHPVTLYKIEYANWIKKLFRLT